MSIFEIIMLVCFGISWPISIAKSIRTKVVEGKSPVFMVIVCLGYVSGMVHKTLHSLDWVIVLYFVNMVLIIIDIALYFKYMPQTKQ